MRAIISAKAMHVSGERAGMDVHADNLLSSRGVETGQPERCLFPRASRTGARGTENRSEQEA